MDNTQPPMLGPQYPSYPVIEETVYVDGGVLAGNVYPCFVQQYAGALTLRPRYAAYVWDANGTALPTGYYNARLIGSYLNLPLFVTYCCP